MCMLIGTRRALLGGRKLVNAILFNATNTLVNCGSEAALDDQPDGGATTVEAWVRPDALTQRDVIAKISAGFVGWGLFIASTGKLQFYLNYDATSTSALSAADTIPHTGKLHHLAGTYNEGGDRKARAWLDGVLVATGAASVGNYVTDAALNMVLGGGAAAAYAPFNGAIAWARVSNSVRYTATFTPPSLLNLPAVDANTLAQYDFLEGSGTTLDNVEGTAARDGTISNGEWIKVAP